MAFPATSVLSSFTGTDQDPLSEGGIWTTGAGVGVDGRLGQLTRVSNAVGARSGNAFYNVATFGPDCESYCTLSTLPGNGLGGTYCFVRLSAVSATPDGYSLDWRLTGGTPTLRIIRYDDGAGTTLDAWTQALSVGDKIGLEAIGSTLKAYIYTGGSWATSGSPQTDATYVATGYIGFGISDANARVDDFGGGGIGQKVLPDADLAAGGWTTSPLFSKINDVSDATYITATAS